MRLLCVLMATIMLTAGLSAQSGQTTTQPAAPKAPAEKAAPLDDQAPAGATASQPTAAKAAVNKALPIDPKAQAVLVSLRKVLGELEAFGKAAAKPVTKLRRSQKLAPAKGFLRFVEKRLGKMAVPNPAPDAAQVEATARQLSALAVEFVGFSDKGLGAAKEAAASAKGAFEKAALEELHKQLYTQIVLANIAEYDGSGTYDGMFDKSASFGKETTADAFLRVYLDLDQNVGTRTMAGEGVAQLGSKRHLDAVREVYEDPFEERPIKDKAKEIMARLGDMTLINKDLEGLQANLKTESAKLAKLEAEMAALQKEAQAASGPDATEEQKAGLKGLQESMQQKQRELVDAIFNVGRLYNQIAFVYQSVRLNQKTEVAYRKCLDHWLRIWNLLFRDPNYRGQVAISFYNLACVQSLQKKVDEAMQAMENCFKWGYNKFDWALQDGDLRNLRLERGEAFNNLIAEVKSGEAEKRWRKEAEEQNEKAGTEEKSGDEGAKPDGEGEKPDGDS